LQSGGTANIFSGTVAVVVPDHGSSSDTALASSLEEDGTPSVFEDLLPEAAARHRQ
jgi:hypothetical protein